MTKRMTTGNMRSAYIPPQKIRIVIAPIQLIQAGAKAMEDAIHKEQSPSTISRDIEIPNRPNIGSEPVLDR
jgi:hypothetical protein